MNRFQKAAEYSRRRADVRAAAGDLGPQFLAPGQPLVPGFSRLPPRAAYECGGGVHKVTAAFQGVGPAEAELWQHGGWAFALMPWEGMFFMLWQIGGEWNDGPFSWWLIPREDRVLPPAPDDPNFRHMLTVILADADNGLIRAVRPMTLSPAFSRLLDREVRRQAAAPWAGVAAHQEAIARAYAAHPTPAAMAAAPPGRCRGGD